MATRRVRAFVTDDAGNTTEWNGTLTQVVPNTPPVVSGDVAPPSANVGTMRTITLTASDAEGGPLTYICEVETAENSNVYAPASPTAQPNVFTVVG